MLKLPRLTNRQYEQIAAMAAQSGIPITQCPTCLAKPIEVAPGVEGWENGTYRFRGEEHNCDCDTQKLLRMHYFAANIGDQYQRLDWRDYTGSEEVKKAVSTYLEKWERFRINGMGLEFASPKLGVGKTFAATYVGKELIKRGENVFFIPFLEVISTLSKQHADHEELERRLYDSTVLILDEVIPPWTAPQQQLFAGKFEELIRNRTNFNKVNIMTTNLTEDALYEHYPRTYSLLTAKQVRVVLDGADARQGKIADENLELVMNDEVRPIT
jgi:DNA replication protein DnaC